MVEDRGILILKGAANFRTQSSQLRQNMVRNNLLSNRVQLGLLSVLAHLNRGLRFRLKTVKAGLEDTPAMHSAVVEQLQDRLLLSGVPTIFYVHSDTQKGQNPPFKVYKAHFLTDSDGNYIVDHGTLPSRVHLYATADPDSKTYVDNPNNYMIFPYNVSIDSIIANANSYDLSPSFSVTNDGLQISFPGFSQMVNDQEEGGSQDFQRPPGDNDFVRAFTDAGYFGYGLTFGTRQIPENLVEDGAVPFELNSLFEAILSGNMQTIQASPHGELLSDQGWQYAQKLLAASGANQASVDGS